MTAREFIVEGGQASHVLAYAGVQPSTYYYKPSSGRRGRVASQWTYDEQGRRWSEQEVVQVIGELLSQEFVDYGYY